MNANEIIENSQINNIGIMDDDKSLDGTKSFADIKTAIIRAIDVIDEALPKMKAAGVDMKKAAGDAEGLFRNVVRKGWGASEVEFYVTYNDSKAITAITPRHLDGIVSQIVEFVSNY